MSMFHFDASCACKGMAHPDLRVPPLDKQRYNKLTRATIEALNKPGATNSSGRVATMPQGAFAFITSPRNGLLNTVRSLLKRAFKKSANTGGANMIRMWKMMLLRMKLRQGKMRKMRSKMANQSDFTKNELAMEHESIVHPSLH